MKTWLLRSYDEEDAPADNPRRLMLFVNNPAGQAIYHDPAWEALTGQNIARSLGTAWLDRVHVEDRAFVEDTHLAGVKARTEYSIQYRLLRDDDRPSWVYVAVRASIDQTRNAVLGFIGSLTVLPEDIANERAKTCGFIQHDERALCEGNEGAGEAGVLGDSDPLSDLRKRLGAALEHSRQARRRVDTDCAFRTRVVLDTAVIELARELKRLDAKD